MSYASSESETWILEAVDCQKRHQWFRVQRTEISLDKFLHMAIGIFAQEYKDPAHTKDTNITVRVAGLKLLQSGRDVGEARKEDVHNGERVGGNWLAGEGIRIVISCHNEIVMY
jgi:hypothetical protein